MCRASNTRMKVISFIICLALLSGCHGKENIGDALPDSSPVLHFNDFVSLGQGQGYTLCDLKVNRIFQNIYNGGDPDEKYLVVDCTVEHVFFTELSQYDGLQWLKEDSTIFLWITVTDLNEAVPDMLRAMLEKIDSVIVYGREIEPVILKDSAECAMFEKEIGEDDLYFVNTAERDSMIEFPPCIGIFDLRMWEVFPIEDGAFKAELIEEIVSKTNDGEISYSMDYEWAKGFQYFKNGDSKAKVYWALEKYVRENSEEK